MEWLASYCLTEPGSGSDAAALKTRAVATASDYVLNGAKQFISGAGDSDLYVVMVRTGEDGPRGISTLVVPKDAPGLSLRRRTRHKMGWHMQSTRQVIFDDCRVPVENRLAGEGEGFRIAMAGLDGGRLNIAACSLGGAQSALDKALAYTGERKAFGQTIDRVPGAAVQAGRHGDRARRRRALLLYAAASKLDRKAPDAAQMVGDGQALRHRHRLQRRQRRAAAARRLRLSARLRRSRSWCATCASTRSSKAPTRSCASSSRAHLLGR